MIDRSIVVHHRCHMAQKLLKNLEAELAGLRRPAKRTSDQVVASSSADCDVGDDEHMPGQPAEKKYPNDGPHSAVESLRVARKMPIFAECGLSWGTKVLVEFDFDPLQLLCAVETFVSDQGRLPKRIGPRWWPGEYPLGPAFWELTENIASVSWTQRDDITADLKTEIATRVGKLMENKQAHGYTRCEEKSMVTGGHMSHLASDWIEWDGKDMSAFALPGDGGDGREHEDHGIVKKVEAFVQNHWGLPREVTNLGIPLEEMEAELAQEFSSMKSKVRAGVYDKHRATHKQALALESFENLKLVGTVRGAGVRGGQFSAKFGKDSAAKRTTGVVRTQLQDALIDQERVSLAIDWLRIDSNPAAKKDAADKALVARQRELDGVSPLKVPSSSHRAYGRMSVDTAAVVDTPHW